MDDPKLEIVRIPLIFWKLDEKNLAAHLVGTDYELIGQNQVKLKSMFSEQIQKDERLEDFRNFPEVEKPRLLLIRLTVRPSFMERGTAFPTSEILHLKVPMIYGLGKYQSYECFFPLFRLKFHCYLKEQIRMLGEHYAKDFLLKCSPEEAYSYLLPGEPWLDELRVNLKPEKAGSKKTGLFSEKDMVSGVAEKLPHAKGLRQKIKIFPDAAWEQSAYIDKVYGKIYYERANIILTGERGVGKSAVIHEVIRRIDKQSTGHNLSFWRTTPRQIISGARYLGDWQELFEDFLDEMQAMRGVLWLEDILSLLYTGGDGPEDSMAAFMLPFIKKRKFQIIGEMTVPELEAARRILPGFAEHFQIIRMEEMDQSATLKIFDLFNDYSSKNLKVQFDREALQLSFRLLNRFIPYEQFPGKAIRFLSGLVSAAIDKNTSNIEEKEIIEAFTDKSGMPDFILRDDIMLDKNELREYFTSQIIGQDEAMDKVTSVIKVYKTAVNNPQKPIATMIFAGPTGVGKTAAVKLLAEYFFGHGQKTDPLIRLDMSEFQHPAQIQRLIGSGGREPGKMVRFVRERPFCVLLLDEIEKAHPLIFDALMTVFDEGILVDAHGRQTDFRNTIIIMTTNLGSKAGTSIGLAKSREVDYTGPIRNHFRPEFFNRIDHTVIFRPLGPSVIREIARKELRELESREGFKKNNISLRFTEEVIDYIAETGFDKNFGARPLQRAIEKNITTKLARYLLRNKNLKDCVLNVGVDKGEIVIDL